MTTDPPIIPPASTPPDYGVHAPVPVVAPPVSHVKKKTPLLPVFAAGIAGIVFLMFLFIGRSKNNSTGIVPALTPTPTDVPVVSRPLSAMATTSAFLEFELQLDTVTRGIQNAPIDNQSLLPPRIDLPLGF